MGNMPAGTKSYGDLFAPGDDTLLHREFDLPVGVLTEPRGILR